MSEAARSAAPAPIRPLALAPAQVERRDSPDGSVLLRTSVPIAPYEPSLAGMFRAAVDAAPDRLFLAERAGDAWRTVTYAEARAVVDAIAAALVP